MNPCKHCQDGQTRTVREDGTWHHDMIWSSSPQLCTNPQRYRTTVYDLAYRAIHGGNISVSLEDISL